jgi:hypothetical protein
MEISRKGPAAGQSPRDSGYRLVRKTGQVARVDRGASIAGFAPGSGCNGARNKIHICPGRIIFGNPVRRADRTGRCLKKGIGLCGRLAANATSKINSDHSAVQLRRVCLCATSTPLMTTIRYAN